MFKKWCIQLLIMCMLFSPALKGQGLFANQASFTSLAVTYLPIYLFEGTYYFLGQASELTQSLTGQQRQEAEIIRQEALDFMAEGKKSRNLEEHIQKIRTKSLDHAQLNDEQIASYLIVLTEQL